MGWRTVRLRWLSCLPSQFDHVEFFHPEKYGRTDLKRGFRTLSRLFAMRKAAKHAYAKGHRNILVATNGESALLKPWPDVRYFIYGDATHSQFRSLYLGSEGSWKQAQQVASLVRLAEKGHHFFAMSNWCMEGMRKEYSVPEGQVTLLPPPMDAHLFVPRERPPHAGLNVLFLGADYYRKGGDIILELARDPELQFCNWHMVTEFEHDPLPNVTYHTGIKPQSDELLRIMGQCDVLALPTRADCSSLAGLEALSMEIPVIITGVGGTPDIVTTGFNGFLLDRAEPALVKAALQQYHYCPELLEEHGKNGRQRVLQQNNLDVHVKRIADTILGK
jgi:glycosyltransferase involved in cell wall biosynthesis